MAFERVNWKKLPPPRTITFFYGPAVYDPSFMIGMQEWLPQRYKPGTTELLDKEPRKVSLTNIWRVRLARWLVDLLLPRIE